jgi:hypothetical protein
VVVLAREGVEVCLHALQTITEQFQLCEWEAVASGKAIFVFENNIWIMGCT